MRSLVILGLGFFATTAAAGVPEVSNLNPANATAILFDPSTLLEPPGAPRPAK
ncbi:MAG: hypothetical protein ACJAZO_005142 [Myxococcota bacterium]|jgi:hypothetical protein